MPHRLKVLFVCPFPHYTGHYSWASIHETGALAEAGVDVILLTFCGLQDEANLRVPQIKVRQFLTIAMPIYYLATGLRKWKLTQRLAMFIETWLILSVAVRLKKKLGIDVYHLRDGEPFPFMVHLMNMNNRNYKWVVSLTGTNLINYPPLWESFKRNFGEFFYLLLLRAVNSSIWKPVYKRNLSRNQFLFITQNVLIKQRFELFVGGALAGKVRYLPLGIKSPDRIYTNEEARRYFGLPADKTVLLSFGFYHVGKDLETVFAALRDMPDIMLLHGGHSGLNTNFNNILALAEKYNMAERSIIKNTYIPEDEKPLFFCAADATVLSYSKDFCSTTSLLWEACRFETPVIASDNPQLKELVEKFKCGILFESQNPESLIITLKEFTGMAPEEKAALKENCRMFSEEFSLERWGEKCQELYRAL